MSNQESSSNRPTTDAFCITCGGPDPVADGECADCLREEIDVVRGPGQPVVVEVCQHCGAMPVKDQWKEPRSLQEEVEKAAIGSLKVPGALEDLNIGLRVHERTKDHYTIDVHLEGTYKTVDVTADQTVEVRVRGASCPACSRRHGGYFEAIVQLRQEGDAEVQEDHAGDIAQIIEDEVRRLGGMAGGQSYLLKVEPMHGGFDYYFGTMNVARAVVRRIIDRYGAKTTETISTVGRRDGQDVNRLTIAVKIPEATPGAILGLDDEVLRVQGRKGNRMLTFTIPDGEKRMLEERDLDRARILEPETVDVVYAEAGEGQILEPETYKTIEVRLPREVDMGDQVHAVRYKRDWIVVGKADR